MVSWVSDKSKNTDFGYFSVSILSVFYTDAKVAKKVLIVPFFRSSINSLHVFLFFKKNGSRRSRPIFRFFVFSREDFCGATFYAALLF